MKKQYLIIGFLILVVAVVVAVKMGFVGGGNVDTKKNTSDVSNVSEVVGDPVEVTMKFYKQWLSAVQDSTTNPYLLGLTSNPIISDDVQEELEMAKGDIGTRLDPVLCQSVTPKKIGAKALSQLDNIATVMVVARGGDTKSPDQAVVTLGVADHTWQITGIACASGESAPEREFAFDREGFLLQGVPPNMDPNIWYLVFEENGEAGHVAPLSFDVSSVCISPEGNEGTCDPSEFTNPSKAHVQGGMTEAGVVVQRIQMLGEE